MTLAQQYVQVATTKAEKNRLDIQIEALNRQIDEQVYELYGLTEDEKSIVEGNTK